jgi:aminoglycoside 3-N-acetyltransferase
MDHRRKIWNWLKKKFKIRSKDLLIQKYRYKFGKLIYHKKYDTTELVELMKDMGLKEGSNVLIHSSWNEFYNYTGTIKNFIDAIIEVIGEKGTLAMPAYPLLRKKTSVFDIKRTPTMAGLIAEEFRKYPGVKRSVSMHSVCALGPKADFLIKDHMYSVTNWDKKSPYFKLSEINGIVFTFGLGKYFVGTIMHCADSILSEESPYFAQFFTKKITNKYVLKDRKVYECDSYVSDDTFRYHFTDRSHNRVISKYFDSSKYKRNKLSNLTVNMYDATYFINRSIELGRRGITVYTKPKFEKRFLINFAKDEN